MVKEPYVIDLIRGDYIGHQVEYESQRHGRRKIIIRPINSLRKKELPYKLDPEKDIHEFDTQLSRIKFLTPTSDIEGVNNANTVLSRIVGQQEEQVSKLQKQLEDERREKKKYRKKWRQLKDEDEEFEPEPQSQRFRCIECGDVSTENQWEEHGWSCPSCGRQGTEEVVG